MPIRKKKWKDSMNGNVIKNYSSMLLCLMCILFLFPARADCRQESAQADTVIKTPGTLEELLELARKCPAEVGFYGRNFRSGNEVEYRPDQGSVIRYFVIKSSDGVIRAAFDACDVCWQAGRGYFQKGDYMVCRNCGRRFASVLVNEVKGGCNPAPLQRRVEGDDVIIEARDILAGVGYFDLDRGD